MYTETGLPTTSTSPGRRKLIAATVGLIWVGAIAAGTLLLMGYANSPGKQGATPPGWPDSSRVPHDQERPTLVMFVHPHCPCSKASIGELALLMAHCQGRVQAHVLFLQPEGMPADWVQTATWQDASQIPGVTVATDIAGHEMQLFGAETSGDTVLYDVKGRLLFHGGITMARGHSGDNPGRDTLQAMLLGAATRQNTTPVFGCSLFDQTQATNR